METMTKMKITKTQLKQIIKEELEEALNEEEYDAATDARLVRSGPRHKKSRSYGSGISSVDKPRPPQSAEERAISMYKAVLQGYMRDPNTERRLGRPVTLEDALGAIISNDEDFVAIAYEQLKQEMDQERPAGGGLGGPGEGPRHPTPEEIEAGRRYEDK